MGKNRTAQSTQTTAPDATTNQWIANYRNAAASRYDQMNATPTSGPLASYGNAAQSMADQLPVGMERGLGGIDAYTNPYESSVVSATQGDFDRQRGLAAKSAADEATKAGAFGGSRAAVLKAGLLSGVNRDESSTLANLRQTGFNTATGNLMADRNRAAVIGSQGAQGLLGYGQYLDQRSRDALSQYAQGLQFGGSTTTGTYRPPYNDFKDYAGLAISGAGLFA